MTPEKRSPKLEPGCPHSGFWAKGPNAGAHCGCAACCFCGRPNPSHVARPRKRYVGRPNEVRAWF